MSPALIKHPPSRMVLPGPFLFMKRPRRREEKEKNTANTPKTMDVDDAGRLYSLDTRVKKTRQEGRPLGDASSRTRETAANRAHIGNNSPERHALRPASVPTR